MRTRLAINGFGRIGRAMLRRALTVAPDVDVVAINTARGTPEELARLFTYDSVAGRWQGEVSAVPGAIIVNGHVIRTSTLPDPAAAPWEDLGVDVVAEATGAFTARADAASHLAAGAAKVLITAPSADADVTLVVGVNERTYDPTVHDIVSGASCTTSCLAPLTLVLDDRFGLRSGLMTTVHAYTNDQSLIDGSHRDPRRGRAAAENIVPTETGAARALQHILPHLAGRITGLAVRVPVSTVSLIDLSVILERTATVGDLHDAFRTAATEPGLSGIIGVCDEPLVSSDFRGDPRSCVIDAASTRIAPGQVKLLAWYDNEWSYAARMVDLVRLLGGSGATRSPRPWAADARAEVLPERDLGSPRMVQLNA